MLRTYLRSVSGPLSRHVCLSCLARPGAPSLRQFHRISALRTNAGETEPTINSFDASTEPSLEIEKAEATQSGVVPSDAAPSEAPLKAALSEAARVEAEKINALQQKAIPTDEDGQGKVAEDKEEGSQPEAEIPTDGPTDTPPASGSKKRTFNLQSTSNVAAQILEASKRRMDNPELDEAELEKLEGEEIPRFVDGSGSLSSTDRRLHLKAVPAPLPPVPRVAFGLDRVLFNPGVYQLRDPRTLVYNFDPYLDQIMPVTEFDFGTLKPYITSSQDVTACQMTRENGKKYYGSSSSMTSVLSHFHYLLSDWRPVNVDRISRGYEDPTRSFTRILRAPAVMFLHYKADEDVYAIDADKEYDYANILMNLGKSMEKQLTMPKEQFERYRRSDPNKITAEEEAAVPESYHYSTSGKFFMRSQLDAYDPRLPGTGMFDLKTRAAVSIRMESTDHKRGMGYEIRRRYGKWESFEREYFDMIRAAFLKYSLQVRIGRMDGIFVAYHNIERIFGFQYIPLSEMDQAIHSSPNTLLGDREFELSLGLWEKVMDKATERYPKQSLRFHFETRESKDGDTTCMEIVAQPVTNDEIEAIQNTNKAHFDAIQDRLMNPDQFVETDYEKAAVGDEEPLDREEKDSETEALGPEDKTKTVPKRDPKDFGSLDQDVLGMRLVVHNKVNGEPVVRPTWMTDTDEWSVDYELKELGIRESNDVLRGCKTRRNSALRKNVVDSNGSFFSILKSRTANGRRYRKRVNEKDREHGILVYQDSCKM
ncbi:Pc20g11660 [Penicillium rubens Wisconsin 54-1255]|uniref:Pc20g11660 protein n=1 Tax=Penicillium rubens (strain ATCC 28089 / DSM 1075 / NRRL 1951 / Wisconsin 54-1255) TaxID=500485 RepID=B6HGA0_PENRW|nr:Pc20g11660 [Penicillium rubens Wisconsin 54-1255]